MMFSGIVALYKHKAKLDLNKLPLEKVKIAINKELNNKLKEKAVVIRYNNIDYIIKCSDIKVRYDVNNIKDRFEGANSLKIRIKRLLGLHDYELSVIYDKDKLVQSLRYIRKQIYIKPENASIKVNNNVLEITPEIIGRDIDFVKLNDLLLDSLIADNSIIYIPIKDIRTKYSKIDLEKVNGVIGGTATKLYSRNFNRTKNIKLALSKLNNKVLYPDESISLNKILGNRTIENGYKEAPVIINNEMDSGIGGGVCQVTSTLYKASLLGCLKIDERRNHSIPSQYIQMGQDATLVQNYVDLKITNNTGSPILLESKLIKSSVVINIYGKVDINQKVTLESHIDKVIHPQPPEIVLDSEMFMGDSKVLKEAKNGYKVSVYRKIYLQGNLIKKEQISVDYYPPTRSKILVGIKWNILLTVIRIDNKRVYLMYVKESAGRQRSVMKSMFL